MAARRTIDPTARSKGSAVVFVRVSDRQAKQLRKEARAAGLSVSDYIRRKVFTKRKRAA
jgi:predicted HicB family RNase H-like nuclease